MGDRHKCNCSRRRRKTATNTCKRRERCARMRQTLVCNAEGESYHEPYMQHLREQFSRSAIECTSSIELPWKDIAISADDLPKLKPSNEKDENVEDEETEVELVRKESTGSMHLPWEDLLITNTVHSEKAKKEMERCDSSLEIPWDDILINPNVKIDELRVDLKKCDKSEVEIPWNDLLMPENVSLSAPRIERRPFCKKISRAVNKKCHCSKSKVQ